MNIVKEVVNGCTDFDLESVLNELMKWKSELDPRDYDDSVAFTTLEGVIDIMIDNCIF